MKKTKALFTMLLLSAALSSMAAITTSTWTGAASTDWSNGANWTNGVPGASVNAIIPNTTLKPDVTTASSVLDISFSAGAALTIDAGAWLDVYGNWTAPNSGVTVSGAGDVELLGNGGLGPYFLLFGFTSFNNLSLYNNYQISAAGGSKVDVRGKLALGFGDLQTNDKLTLKSTAAQTALATSDGGTVTGNATMERYLSGAVGYHHISSAMTDATVGTWSTSFPIRGVDGVGSWIVNREGTLEEYREPANHTNKMDSAYYNYTNSGNPLNQGQGFTALLSSLPITVKTFGTLNITGSATQTITNTAGLNVVVQGWNFLGNPFPAPLSWNAFSLDNPGTMGANSYVWHSTGRRSGNWITYNGTAGTHGAGDVIASQQGFWVYSTQPSSSVTFWPTETVNELSPPTYKVATKQANQIRLRISSANDVGTEIMAYTHAVAGAPADGILPPAPFADLESPSMAFEINDHKYMMHVAESIDQSTEWPLYLELPVAGTYTISAADLNVYDLPVMILDKATNTYYDMSRENLTISTQAGETINHRYSVVFGLKNQQTGAASGHVYVSNGNLIIDRQNTGSAAQVMVTNMMGRQLMNTSISAAHNELATGLAEGIYLVTLKENGSESVTKVSVK